MYSCGSKQLEKSKPEPVTTNVPVEIQTTPKFPDLVPGEFQLKENCFGEVIELSGHQIITNQILQIKETQMVVKDSFLIVQNLDYNNLFKVFLLPDYQHVKSFGKIGGGPGEFQRTSLVKTESPHLLCYIYENAYRSIFSLNKDLTFTKAPFRFSEGATKRQFNDKQIQSFSATEFVYVESIKNGKGIYHFLVKNDSIRNQLIYNLSFSAEHKNWAAYIGDFAANKEKGRMVFAYKYFKRLVFMDSEGKTTRTLIFGKDKAKKGDELAIMSPENTTHYWGISPQNNYVYLLYSGRSPFEVTREWGKKNYYIYVEQYDWNGNPIHKYKLDNWGYFTVDEQRKKIILASVNDAEPFFEYDLIQE